MPREPEAAQSDLDSMTAGTHHSSGLIYLTVNGMTIFASANVHKTHSNKQQLLRHTTFVPLTVPVRHAPTVCTIWCMTQ
jgi:hypothetical protein